jgi:hypothetical protein
MKEITKFYWIVNLLDSKFVKTLFNYKLGTKRDFEIIAQAPENFKPFRVWFDEMIINEVFIKINDSYYIDGRKLENELTKCYLYPKLKRFFDKNKII